MGLMKSLGKQRFSGGLRKYGGLNSTGMTILWKSSCNTMRKRSIRYNLITV